MHRTRLPNSLALESAGRSIAARMARMALTSSNSISVKPEVRFRPRGNIRAFGARPETVARMTTLCFTAHSLEAGFLPTGTAAHPHGEGTKGVSANAHRKLNALALTVRKWLLCSFPFQQARRNLDFNEPSPRDQ